MNQHEKNLTDMIYKLTNKYNKKQIYQFIMELPEEERRFTIALQYIRNKEIA
jgi:hypothetical protein